MFVRDLIYDLRGEFSVQDIATSSPNSKSFRLINLPFYYTGQIDKIIARFG